MTTIEISPQPSDHLVSPRIGYFHHGIYIGDGRVIHYSGLAEDFKAGPVEETSLEAFAGGHGFTIRNYTTQRFRGQAVIERARSRLGEKLYCVYSNNCEHFCQWCINDSHESNQVHHGTLAATGTVAGITGVAARGVALATTAGTIGVASTAGLGLLSSVPALGVAYGFNSTVLKDSPVFDDTEREARNVGRTATYVGATVGTTGCIAAVSASGTVVGLSGSGIAAGLSAIGGGSLTVGAALTVAAPIVTAAALGYGTYKLIKYFKTKY